MSEFDFDELDKAVNSLMQKRDTTGQPAPASQAVVTPRSTQDIHSDTTEEQSVQTMNSLNLEQPVVPRPISDEKYEESSSSSETTQSDQPVPERPAASQIATKRRGQFMDVMHPSADMSKDTTNQTPVTKPPVRRAVTLQPVTPSVAPEKTAEAPSATENSALTSVESEEKLTDWPDPIDVSDQSDSDTAAQPADTSLEDVSLPNDTQTISVTPAGSPSLATELEADSKSMVSPFLPGAKVEKRPLGGDQGVVDNEPSAVESEATDSDITPSTDSGSADPASINTQHAQSDEKIPAELSSSMMDVESDSTSVQEPVNENDKPTETPVERPPVQDSESPDQTQAAAVSSAEPAPVKEVPAVNQLAGVLPPRQTTAPSTEDEPEVKTSIYDTDDHGHMKHVEKHSSGWFAVVIIGSMLVIGAVGGVILFLLNNGY